MKEQLERFFKHFKNYDQVLISEIKEWFFEDDDYNCMNINPYYFFLQNLRCFTKRSGNRKAESILWQKVTKQLKIKRGD